ERCRAKPDVLANPGAPPPPPANSRPPPPRRHIEKRRRLVDGQQVSGRRVRTVRHRVSPPTHTRPQRARERTHSERDGEGIGEPQARSQPVGARGREAATRAGSCPPS